jgi:hypothetical protein
MVAERWPWCLIPQSRGGDIQQPPPLLRPALGLLDHIRINATPVRVVAVKPRGTATRQYLRPRLSFRAREDDQRRDLAGFTYQFRASDAKTVDDTRLSPADMDFHIEVE